MLKKIMMTPEDMKEIAEQQDVNRSNASIFLELREIQEQCNQNGCRLDNIGQLYWFLRKPHCLPWGVSQFIMWYSVLSVSQQVF